MATRSIENPWGIFDEALRARKKQGIQAAWVGICGVGSHGSDGVWRIFFPHGRPVDSLILKKLFGVDRSQKLGAAI